ncbi:MAG: hypothetical protein WCX46_00425 [Candidatus Paceibacterota bacterium]
MKTREIVEFFNSEKVEPESLLTISDEYAHHIPKLFSFLQKKPNRLIPIIFFRIKTDGSFVKNKIYGSTKDVNSEKGTFVFESSKHLDGTLSDDLVQTFIRTDNVLGAMPALDSFQESPYKNSETEIAKRYFQKLSEMKGLLGQSIGKTCAITLFFRYNNEKQNRIFRNGSYSIKTNEILELNNSNFKYQNMGTSAWISEDDNYQDKIPEIRTRTFTSPDYYLCKVVVDFGTQYVLDVYDNNE